MIILNKGLVEIILPVPVLVRRFSFVGKYISFDLSAFVGRYSNVCVLVLNYTINMVVLLRTGLLSYKTFSRLIY